jgi:hypothetical protein
VPETLLQVLLLLQSNNQSRVETLGHGNRWIHIPWGVYRMMMMI